MPGSLLGTCNSAIIYADLTVFDFAPRNGFGMTREPLPEFPGYAFGTMTVTGREYQSRGFPPVESGR